MARRGVHRDSTSPFVVDTRRLSRAPGSTMAFQRTVPAPSRMGLELASVSEGAPIEVDLQLQSLSEGVVVTGTVSAPTSGECARCLKPITGDVEIYLTEMFVDPDVATEETGEDDEDDDVGHIIDDSIDLEQPIIDAIGLALPFAPLCEPDCPGLCPDCGVALATAEPGHAHEKIDPRWAKLAAMRTTEPDSTDPAGESG